MLAQRLRQARLGAGLSQDAAVQLLNSKITKAALSNYEKGKRTPHAKILRDLGHIYGVRPQWFTHEPDVTIEWHAYRAVTKLSSQKKENIQASISKRIENYFEISHLFPSEQHVNFPTRQAVRNFDEVDKLASGLRQQWSLGKNALESVTQCLEKNGALVMHYNLEPTEGFDGLSATVNNKHPVIIVNGSVPADRLRFDLLHELGHVLMDTSSIGHDKEEEKLAHRFASSFLVPPELVKMELGENRRSLLLAELLLLKEKYGMSVAAWIYAAQTHDIIDQTLASKLWRELSRRGWKKKEPDVFQCHEQPTRLKQMIFRAISDGRLHVERAMQIASELKPELELEGLLNTKSKAYFHQMSSKEKKKELSEAAEKATDDYKEDGPLGELSAVDGDGFYEYD